VFVAGELVPNLSIQDAGGVAYNLWDFRQKSHLALIYDPSSGPEALTERAAAISARQKEWDWLNVKIILVSATDPHTLNPGLHVIDRHGRLIKSFPLTRDLLAELESELIYYEARHC
jgi:hypothetical protein